MSLTFVETLRGSYFLVDEPAARRVCEVAITFTVQRSQATGSEVVAAMSGHASFEAIASRAELIGQATLRLSRPRHVAYAFDFVADDGRPLHFEGAKHPSLLRPVYAATTLWGTLSQQQRPLAMVRLHFDLRRDLVAFLQSIAREHQ